MKREGLEVISQITMGMDSKYYVISLLEDKSLYLEAPHTKKQAVWVKASNVRGIVSEVAISALDIVSLLFHSPAKFVDVITVIEEAVKVKKDKLSDVVEEEHKGVDWNKVN